MVRKACQRPEDWLNQKQCWGSEGFPVNLHCYTTILDGVEKVPFMWQGYATRHTLSRAHGKDFDVYFWKKKNLLFRGRRRHARVHFFAVLSEFSKFYLNQAKKNDSLFRLHWKIHFFIYSNCAITDNTFSKTVVLLIIRTCDVILYTQYLVYINAHKRPIAVIVNVSTLGTLLDQLN